MVYLGEADDGELATAHSQMPQVPPSYSEGSRASIESVPILCYVPAKGKIS